MKIKLITAVLAALILASCNNNADANISEETNIMETTASPETIPETIPETEAPETAPTPEAPVTETTDIKSLTVGAKYRGVGEVLFSFKTATATHKTIQGGYFDGKTFYVAEVNQNSDKVETVRIHTMTAEGETIDKTKSLPLDHANNITYNPKINKLIVSHCQSPDGHYYRYSMLDPETFKITETADKSFPFFSMAYSPERDMYASGEWGGERIDICDGDMNHIKGVDVTQPKSLSQGVFCDGDYIYFVRSSQNGAPSEIRIYDWDCNLIFEVPIELDGGIEPESINIVDGVTYIIGNDWNKRCGIVYTMKYELDN